MRMAESVKGLTNVRIIRDLSNIDRVIFGQFEGI
jgi:hypothetical protein